jgi:2-desacetyl-2-hydroxyethyl bacteriochlorophyllide A dehydrogenase
MVLEAYNTELKPSERAKPQPQPGEIVLRVSHCGICGTDLKIASGKLASIVRLPHVPGHEIVGQVESVGRGVQGIREGDRGVAYFYIGCGVCELCRSGKENVCFSLRRLGFERDGGFAEYVSMPAYNFCGYEADIPGEKMAVLPDAVATSYHALKTMGEVRIGQTVLIVGLGGLGIHALQLAKLMGAAVVGTSRRPEVQEAAQGYGADLVVNPAEGDPLQAIRDFTRGRGVDVVIENVGTGETMSWSLPALKKGGKLVLVGYDPSTPVVLDSLSMHYNEWTVRGSRVSTRQELVEVIGLVQRRLIDPVVTRVLPLAQANQGLAEVASKKNVGRVVLAVQHED